LCGEDDFVLHAVIMAGGAGTRFWPASRGARPKQLLPLLGDRTMIQATCDRLAGLVPTARTMVVTNQELVEAMAGQLPDLPRAAMIGEPCKRDTAPCIGLAAGLIAREDPDAILLVMPADHVIRPVDEFQRALRGAVQLVEQSPDCLVTFGIRPTYPAATYGYIERGAGWRIPGRTQPPVAGFHVVRFREKPSPATAQEFLASGNFYWNAGIFVWRAATILQALRDYEPAMAERLRTIVGSAGRAEFETVFAREFAAIEGKSIDYAVMERYPRVAVIEASFEWDDVGNWSSLARTQGTDEQGNTVLGRHLGLGTQGTIVHTTDRHLVVTVGLRDCIVVHTPDATLVANKHDEEAMRQIVIRLRALGWDEYL
jgi:mannose-1-phosphate guanylyltransferase